MRLLNKKNNNQKKLRKRTAVAIFLVVIQVFSLYPNPKQALKADLLGMNLDQIINDSAKELHINKDVLKGYGENLNSSDRKVQAPTVQIFFSPTDPKPGQEITARAFPQFFINNREKLYFTWYIKRKDGSSRPADWKIEAMRTIANGGFDSDAQGVYSSDKDKNMDAYRASFGGDANVYKNKHCFIHDFETGKNYELWSGQNEDGEGGQSECEHLFPNAPGEQTGDKKFQLSEERFWKTDPRDPSTAQNGNKDEANVAGLGQDTFRWVYQSGDQVGVAVEGVSTIPTKYEDSSMMVMWALPKNKCKPTADGVRKLPGSWGGDGKLIIETSSKNINNCLADNLVDPTEGGQAGRLEVKTSFSPENPLASFIEKTATASEATGDTLTVNASVTNSGKDASQVLYDWNVFMAKSPSDSWTNVTSGVKTSPVQGSNLSALTVDLNFDKAKNFEGKYFSDGVGYMKVKVEAKENFSAGAMQVGRSEVVVKLTNTNSFIQLSRVETRGSSPDTKVDFLTSDKGPICSKKNAERILCPVVKNEIVGLKFTGGDVGDYDSFSWTLNGKPLVCGKNVSEKCDDGMAKEVNFFPVTGEPGESYTVNLVATNVESGKTLTLTRNLLVVEPSLQIVSADEEKAWQKFLGEYRDLDGNSMDNYSTSILQAFSGEDVKLKTQVVPTFLSVSPSWTLDGVPLIVSDDDVVEFFLEKPVESVYNVSASATYVQSDDIRRALRDIWGIGESDSQEVSLSSTVQIESSPSDVHDEATSGKSSRFFAALATYVPSSVLLFFRLGITMGLVLFVSGVVFALLPERRRAW